MTDYCEKHDRFKEFCSCDKPGSDSLPVDNIVSEIENDVDKIVNNWINAGWLNNITNVQAYSIGVNIRDLVRDYYIKAITTHHR